ncbi:MAG TPA: hypothetical protein IAB48_11505 [Candidatus Fimimorpha excrementavium]|nr:hypothetical protein [Candidatus Fimimorpha excrementavium]
MIQKAAAHQTVGSKPVPDCVHCGVPLGKFLAWAWIGEKQLAAGLEEIIIFYGQGQASRS